MSDCYSWVPLLNYRITLIFIKDTQFIKCDLIFTSKKKKSPHLYSMNYWSLKFSVILFTFSCELENINMMIELIPITHAAISKNLRKEKRKEVVF